MFRALLFAVVTSVALFAAAAVAQEGMHEHAAAAPSPLDRLKALEGTWTGTADMGGEKNEIKMVWHVTAAGSAVVETQFAGTPHEMVTVYTVEGGNLVLTHYCAAGNQPRMKARKGGPENEIAFDFAGGAGIDPAHSMHMHSARLVFVDADHLHSEWRSMDKGKPGHVGVFDLARSR
jgi:hypothetical protein